MASVIVQLDTRHLPPITIGGGGSSSSSGAGWFGPWLVRFLRPRVRASVGGLGLIDYAPHGRPEGTTWPLLGVVVAAGVALLLVLLVRGALSFRRR